MLHLVPPQFPASLKNKTLASTCEQLHSCCDELGNPGQEKGTVELWQLHCTLLLLHCMQRGETVPQVCTTKGLSHWHGVWAHKIRECFGLEVTLNPIPCHPQLLWETSVPPHPHKEGFLPNSPPSPALWQCDHNRPCYKVFLRVPFSTEAAIRCPQTLLSARLGNPALSASPHSSGSPEPLAGLSPAHPGGSSCAGEPSSGHSSPDVAPAVLCRGAGLPPATCSVWALTLTATSEKNFKKSTKTTTFQSNNNSGGCFFCHTHGDKPRSWMKDLQIFQPMVQAISSPTRSQGCVSEAGFWGQNLLLETGICLAGFVHCSSPLLPGVQISNISEKTHFCSAAPEKCSTSFCFCSKDPNCPLAAFRAAS